MDDLIWHRGALAKACAVAAGLVSTAIASASTTSFSSLSDARPILTAVVLGALSVSALRFGSSRPKDKVGEDRSPRRRSSTSDLQTSAEMHLLKAKFHASEAEVESLRLDIREQATIHDAVVQRYETMFRHLPLACLTLDENGNVMEWNLAAVKLFGLAPYQVLDRPLATIIGRGAFEKLASEALYNVYMGLCCDPVVFDMKLRTGETHRLEWNVTPVLNTQNKAVGAVCAVRSVPF